MTDRLTDAELTARLQGLWTDELVRADADYPAISSRATRAQFVLPMGLAAVVVGVLVLAIVLFQVGGVPGPGGIRLASDGLPVAIGGEPVLRGDEISQHLAEAGVPFLAGGRLVIGGTGCTNGSDPATCVEGWQLTPVDGDAPTFPLSHTAGASGFVRTSGALAVVRVQAVTAPFCPAAATCNLILSISEVVWRAPTKGPVPTNGSGSSGETYDALWPDFISTYGRDGVSIAGYIPKEYLLPGSHDEPMPVYGEDLKTLVGYQVAGEGFVPIAEFSATPVPSAPPVDATPLTVLTVYLQAVQDRNCPAALAAATTDFTPNTNAFCASSLRITGFEINPNPSRPSATEEVFGLTLSTQGGDFMMPDGDHTWFYTLTYQPGIGWRVSGGGTGP